MASKTLPDGRKVLVGSKADPDSSRYTPKTTTTAPRTPSTYDTLEQVKTRANELIGQRDTPTAPETPNYSPRYTTQITEPSVAQPKSAEQIQKEMMRSAQGEINALRDYENTLLDEQRVINEKNDRSTSSINTLTGLAGSTEANVQQQKTTAAGQKANQAIRAETEVKIQTLLGNIRRSAVEEARAQREEARLDEETRLKNRTARQAEAANQLTNLAAGGVTPAGLKNADPKSYQYLVDQFGSEEALKGAWVLSTPQDQILDKKIVGNNFIISKMNPITGKVSVETVAIEGLPPDYSQTVDLGGQIMFYDPSDPQNKQFFVNKSLTPSQASSGGSGSSGGTLKETASEKNALGFYLRGKDAIDTISTIEDDIKAKGLAGQVRLEFAPNFLQSQENQVYRQLQRQFTEARLRKESGAAIPPAEYESDAKTYFAQPGDTNETLARKEQARSVVLESLRIGAGNAYKNYVGDDGSDTSATETYEVDGIIYVQGDDGLYYPQ